ncbi:hydrolase [Streptomyces sp. CT34]|uniref:alpha/beta hydrolase family protein n=1 Tax=Streptomyces sp. CT34 TaxID=1553907 RepID=UPI0005BE75F9|nr:hydrolase [Streptomyces sp. CT34]
MKHARRKQRSPIRARVAGTTGALAVFLTAGIGSAAAAGKATVAPTAKAAPEGRAAHEDQASPKAKATHEGKASPHIKTGPEDRANAPGQLTLPAPTGHYRVGTVDLHLVDPHRTDPWLPGSRPRELMVSLWYPATHTARHPAAPWMQSAAAAHLLAAMQVPPNTVALPTTAGHTGAPVDHKAGKLPVLLYSPGRGSDRATGTALAEDLASRGYLVVTLDDTHESSEVQFPGGRVETSTMPPGTPATKVFAVRVADTRFVIDQLAAIDHGHNPTVEHTPLPHGLAHAIDMNRIGMFGASLGGGTVPAAMQADSRIRAGADLDGQFFGPERTRNLNRPFLLFSSQHHNRNDDGSWATFWKQLHGDRYDLKLRGAEHLSFLDWEALFHEAPTAFHQTPASLVQALGPIAPDRAIEIQRVYLAAFFDKELRHRHSHLLDGPSHHYPEVAFVR